MPHTIAENLTRLTTARTNIANAITAKGGTVTSGDGFEEFPADIATIPSGGESANRNDVSFYDYDGTIVDSYSASDFAALSALPANPTHEGLTAQGWNWSLADAKAYVAKYGKLNIGQMYITDDGKTRVYISLHEGRLSPVLGLGVNGSVDIDWGDGTAHGTLTGSSTATLATIPHTYSQGGDYVITLTAAEGTTVAVQGSNWESLLLTKDGTGGNQSRVYCSALKKAYLGDGVTVIGSYAFQYCSNLASVTVSDSVTSIGNNAFINCYGIGFIRFESNTPPTAASSTTFSSLPTDCIIYVPEGTLEAYTSATNYPDDSVYTYVEY